MASDSAAAVALEQDDQADGRGAEVYLGAFGTALRPDPRVTVGQWADQHRYLSAKASAEPGRYRCDRTPYLIEIMECLSPSSPVQEVAFMKGAQVGGSESGFNWLGFIIDRAPAPTLMVQPTVGLAETVSKQRIGPMIEACPTLKAKVLDLKKGREVNNTVLGKEFPGGMLAMAGANSAAGLRSMPIKNLMLDEVDAYPEDVDGEGSPIELAKKRTGTFARRKIFYVSTPTYKGTSNIERLYSESDQRRYHVPCPFCDHYQPLKWSGIKWKRDGAGAPVPESARYQCEACEELIPEHHKSTMLARGRWIADNPDATIAGFHLSALYSPLGWYSWAEAVSDWYKAQKDPNRLKVFVNTVLGETYEIKGEDTPKWKEIYARRETYPLGSVPLRAVFLTAACDVQKDRLEVTVAGWNRKEMWIVDHQELRGDTSQPAVWLELDKVLANSWTHESGAALSISILAVDSGFNTTRVYEYVRRHNPRQVIPIKGQDELPMPIGAPKALDIKINGRRIKRGVRLWSVGSSMLKAEVYGRLKHDRPTDERVESDGYPPTYVHFPQLSEEYFRQLTAEQLVYKADRNGKGRYRWVKTHPNNEALDLVCYNIAALYAHGANRWGDQQWRQLEAMLTVESSTSPPAARRAPATEPAPPPPQAPARRRRESSFW